MQDSRQGVAGAAPGAVRAVLDLLARTRSRGAQCSSGGVLIGIDGRSGSGKTDLASEVARSAASPVSVRVLALEDAYRGWGGLREGLEHLAQEVLAPLRRGEEGRYRRWDWNSDALGEEAVVRPVGPGEALLVEGCGAASMVCAPFLDATIWVEAPEHVRRARAMARDDGTWAALWDTWADQESALLAEYDAPVRADLVLPNAG